MHVAISQKGFTLASVVSFMSPRAIIRINTDFFQVPYSTNYKRRALKHNLKSACIQNTSYFSLSQIFSTAMFKYDQLPLFTHKISLNGSCFGWNQPNFGWWESHKYGIIISCHQKIQQGASNQASIRHCMVGTSDWFKEKGTHGIPAPDNQTGIAIKIRGTPNQEATKSGPPKYLVLH